MSTSLSRYGIATGVVVAAAAVAAVNWPSEKPAPSTVSVRPVPAATAVLAPGLGTVGDFVARDGQTVTAGQVLVALNDRTERAELAKAEAEFKAASRDAKDVATVSLDAWLPTFAAPLPKRRAAARPRPIVQMSSPSGPDPQVVAASEEVDSWVAGFNRATAAVKAAEEQVAAAQEMALSVRRPIPLLEAANRAAAVDAAKYRDLLAQGVVSGREAQGRQAKADAAQAALDAANREVAVADSAVTEAKAVLVLSQRAVSTASNQVDRAQKKLDAAHERAANRPKTIVPKAPTVAEPEIDAPAPLALGTPRNAPARVMFDLAVAENARSQYEAARRRVLAARAAILRTRITAPTSGVFKLKVASGQRVGPTTVVAEILPPR